MSIPAATVRRRMKLWPGRVHSSVAWWAGVVLLMIVALAIFGPFLVPHGPNENDLLNTNGPASLDHPFGTDALGRDIFSRVVHGARISLLGPLIVTVGAVFFGTIIAVSSAWIGGRFDAIVGLITDISMAFPSLLLAILVAAFVGPGLWAPIIAIMIANIPYATRLIRSAAIAERSLPYVDALYLQGFRGLSVALRHLIPNISGFLAALATLTFGYSMIDLAAVSFLGLGVQPPTPEWGSMISEGQAAILEGAPQQSLAAGAFIVVTVIAVNILGEALADRSTGRK